MAKRTHTTAWMIGLGLATGASVAAAQTLALYDAFTDATGIEVNVLEGDSDQLIERIRREGAASPADVFMTVDAARLQRAENAGILAPVDSEVLESRLPAALQHPDDLWFGFSERVRVVYYNTDVYDEPPLERYEDLADARFDDEICIRSSSNDYNQSLVASLIAANGLEATEAWAEGLVENMARPPQGGDTDQLRAVAAGECSLGVGNHYYYTRLELSDDPQDQAVVDTTALFFPNQDDRGAHRNIGGAALVDGAPNADAAVQFLEFLASDEAQRMFSMGNNEFPAVDGIEPIEALQPYADRRLDDLNVGVLGENNAQAVRLMDRAGWR
jgi:iron(III) transport system substrate-binding protein